MFDEECDLPDEPVVVDDRVGESDARVEVEVVHRQRLLEHIPKGLLRIGDEEVGIERQLALGKPLADAQLEFHIRVLSGRFTAQRRTHDEVVVFEKREVGALVQLFAHAVGVVFGYVAAYLSIGDDSQKKKREEDGKTFHRQGIKGIRCFANISESRAKTLIPPEIFCRLASLLSCRRQEQGTAHRTEAGVSDAMKPDGFPGAANIRRLVGLAWL